MTTVIIIEGDSTRDVVETARALRGGRRERTRERRSAPGINVFVTNTAEVGSVAANLAVSRVTRSEVEQVLGEFRQVLQRCPDLDPENRARGDDMLQDLQHQVALPPDGRPKGMLRSTIEDLGRLAMFTDTLARVWPKCEAMLRSWFGLG